MRVDRYLGLFARMARTRLSASTQPADRPRLVPVFQGLPADGVVSAYELPAHTHYPPHAHRQLQNFGNAEVHVVLAGNGMLYLAQSDLYDPAGERAARVAVPRAPWTSHPVFPGSVLILPPNVAHTMVAISTIVAIAYSYANHVGPTAPNTYNVGQEHWPTPLR